MTDFCAVFFKDVRVIKDVVDLGIAKHVQIILEDVVNQVLE